MDAHEEPRHAGVGDRDRPAGGDLAHEGGDDAAAAAEDVAEADGAADGVVGRLRQHDLLAEALRRAHHVDRPHRLVGGDEHEALDARALGGPHDGAGAEDVRRDRLARVVLEEGDVLVGRGVEHDLRPVAVEQVVEERGVADVAQQLDDRSLDAGRHLVEVGLVVVDEDERAGPQVRHLAGDLGADRAARTRDEDAAALQQAAYRIEVGRDLLAAEEVFDPQVADVAHRDACVHEVGDAGQHPEREACDLRRVHRPAHDRVVGRRDGQHDLVHLEPGERTGKVIDAADHRHAHQLAALGARVVVEHGHRHEPGAGAAEHVAQDGRAGLTGADDGDAQSGRGVRATVEGEEPGLEATRSGQHGGDRGAEEHDGERRQPAPGQDEVGDQQGREARAAGEHDLARLLDAGVPPKPAVEPPGPVAAQVHDEGDDQESVETVPVGRRDRAVEPEHHDADVGRRHEDQVERGEQEVGTHLGRQARETRPTQMASVRVRGTLVVHPWSSCMGLGERACIRVGSHPG